MNLLINNTLIQIKVIKFSDKAVNFCLPEDLKLYSTDTITVQIPEEEDINSVLTKLVQLYSSFPAYADTEKAIKINLTINYLPYARADRRFGINQSNGLAAWVHSLVKCINIASVTLVDPHSYVAAKLFKDVGIPVFCLEQEHIVPEFLGKRHEYDFIVSPDKGAMSKACKVAERLSLPVCVATKTRNPTTGELLGEIETSCGSETLTGKSLLIVDDLIDGGMTFINLASRLKKLGAKKVALYVTHGIFSKGLTPLEGVLDKIYVYQLIGDYVNRKDLIKFNSNTYTKEIN